MNKYYNVVSRLRMMRNVWTGACMRRMMTSTALKKEVLSPSRAAIDPADQTELGIYWNRWSNMDWSALICVYFLHLLNYSFLQKCTFRLKIIGIFLFCSHHLFKIWLVIVDDLKANIRIGKVCWMRRGESQDALCISQQFNDKGLGWACVCWFRDV